jgi:hypothetical protein
MNRMSIKNKIKIGKIINEFAEKTGFRKLRKLNSF